MQNLKTSEIKIKVELSEEKIPISIAWFASDSTLEKPQETKAFLLSVWDPHYKESLRIDLWTKDMLLEEMNIFFFETLMGLADTYQRASQDETIAKRMKDFALEFGEQVQVIKKK